MPEFNYAKPASPYDNNIQCDVGVDDAGERKVIWICVEHHTHNDMSNAFIQVPPAEARRLAAWLVEAAESIDKGRLPA